MNYKGDGEMTCSPRCTCARCEAEAARLERLSRAELLEELRRSRLWTDREVSAHLALPLRTLQDHIALARTAGVDVPWIRVGRSRRWYPDRIERWLRDMDTWRTSRRETEKRARGSSSGEKQAASGQRASGSKPTRRRTGGRSKPSRHEDTDQVTSMADYAKRLGSRT